MGEEQHRPRRHSSFTRSLIAPLNSEEEILIPNPEQFQAKLEALALAGSENIELVSDFDFTLSRYRVDGVRGASTYQILQNGVLDEEKRKIVTDLYHYYHPIEVDSEISLEEKTKLLNDWWSKGNEIIISAEVYKDMMPDLLSHSPLYLRNAIDRVVWLCQKHSIPFTVISAGVGDIIDTALKGFSHYEGLRMFSNFMLWDDEGKLHAFSEPPLRTTNKNIILAENTPKSHIILLGDIPADTKMIEHANHQADLKIGFLNNLEIYDLEDYKKHYDMLILHDGNLVAVEAVLSAICKEEYNFDHFPSLEPLKEHLSKYFS